MSSWLLRLLTRMNDRARSSRFASWPLFRWMVALPKACLRGVVHGRLRRQFRDLTVRHGPFAGMRYPEFQSVGSSLFPKLLGSYESELHQSLGDIIARSPMLVIDIGCAEGYYAVGLARAIPGAHVLAFDLDPQARDLCRQMADLNGVGGRVEIREECTRDYLAQVEAPGRALLVCDCEGCEADLFDDAVARQLAPFDVVIELHEGAAPGVTQRLTDAFSDTHECTLIECLDDATRVDRYDFPELEGAGALTRRYATAERRGASTHWLVGVARSRP